MGPAAEQSLGTPSTWAADVPAGLVVFLVALPLCLGIALASDAPLGAGLLAGILAGLVIAPLSGSHLSVSGPAAGLTVLVASGIDTLGGFDRFLAATVVAGLLQLAMAGLRAGFVASLFPVSVIKGMLAGIGLILILKQIPHALGVDADYEGDEAFWESGDANTFTEIVRAVGEASPGVALVSAVGLAILLLWQRPALTRQAWARWVPGPLVVVVVGAVMNAVYRAWFPAWEIHGDAGHLVQLPAEVGLGGLFALVTLPDLSALAERETWEVGAIIAAIASLETLLSVEAVDKLDPLRRVSDQNRELLAQGVGNVAAGLLGALPMTAVIVRSSANVQAGGLTRWSAIVHGLLLVAAVVALAPLLNEVPLAALAAVLLMVGFKLTPPSLWRRFWHGGLDQFLPFAVTALGTVLTDLLTGVILGLAVGFVMVLITNFTEAVGVEVEGEQVAITFLKDVSFLNKLRFREALAAVPDGATVTLDGTRAAFIDPDILDMVADFRAGAPLRGITVHCRDVDSKAHPLRLGRAARPAPGDGPAAPSDSH